MCNKHKRSKLPLTDLGAWLNQAKEDSEVARMGTVPSFIWCYHAQQAIEKLLKAALIACLGNFKLENEEIVNRRRSTPPDEKFAKLYLPAGAWSLPDHVDFPFTHDLCKLWGELNEIDGQFFMPLSEEDKCLMNKASRYAKENRYPSYRHELGIVVGYAPGTDVDHVMSLLEKYVEKLRNYVLQRALQS